MDLNYLYHRRGVSLAMSDQAGCDRSRDAHLRLAASYSDRIENARHASRRTRDGGDA